MTFNLKDNTQCTNYLENLLSFIKKIISHLRSLDFSIL